MLKKIVLLVCTSLVILGMRAYGSVESQAIPSYKNELLTEITGYGELSEFVGDVIEGKASLPDGFFQKLIHLVSGDVKGISGYIISILGFTVLASCVKGSQIKLAGGLSDISFFVSYFVISAFLLGVLFKGVGVAQKAADELVVFTRMTLPAYIGIITSTGVDASASQGVFLMMVNAVSGYAGDFMINAFFYIGILTIVGNMSSEIKITKIIYIARQILFWILGFLLTVFAGMTALSGLAVSASSSVGIRAAKYTIGHAIPVVGGFLADSTELILASAKIFKNAFGTVGIAVLALVCLVPVVKLFIIGFLLKITAGLTEPFCDKLMSDSIYGIGQTVIHIMVTVLLMAVMFILAFAVLINL